MSGHTFGTGPLQVEYEARMKEIGRLIDYVFNGSEEPKRTGFVLLVFPFDGHTGRCNYLSNSVRADVKTLLKEQLSYMEGQSDQHPPGHA